MLNIGGYGVERYGTPRRAYGQRYAGKMRLDLEAGEIILSQLVPAVRQLMHLEIQAGCIGEIGRCACPGFVFGLASGSCKHEEREGSFGQFGG